MACQQIAVSTGQSPFSQCFLKLQKGLFVGLYTSILNPKRLDKGFESRMIQIDSNAPFDLVNHKALLFNHKAMEFSDLF